MNIEPHIVGIILLSYLIGSLPFGFIIAKLAGIGDIRKQGSGNVGATNMARVGGKKLGALTLALDLAKGVIGAALAQEYLGLSAAFVAAGSLVVLGHMFPVWLKFKGGKGVATTCGVLVTIYWPLGLLSIAIWTALFLATRIASIASTFAMIVTPAIALYFAKEIGYHSVYLTLIICILVVVCHYENIRRLIRGEERPIK